MQEVKKYLNQAIYMDRYIVSRAKELDALRYSFLPSVALKDVNVQESNAKRYDERYMSLFEIESIIEEKIDEAVAKRVEISNNIDKVDDVIYSTLLRNRYINGMKWEDIADITNQSERHVFRQHGHALVMFKKANPELFANKNKCQ